MPHITTQQSGMILALVTLFLVWLVVRALLKPSASAKLKLMSVLGSGGHTAELFRVICALDMGRFSPRVYVVADTDMLGEVKAKHFEEMLYPGRQGLVDPAVCIRRIPRSREVGQSWISSIFTTLWALIVSVWAVLTERPRLVLVNGPGTCLPVCMAAHVLRLLWLLDVKIVFVESIARTQHLSLTGKLLYMLDVCDLFFVQWPELQYQFPKTRCIGRVY